MSVLINQGGGTFAPQVTYTAGSGAGCNPNSVTMGDLSGNGEGDAAFVNANDGTVSLLFSQCH